MRDPPQQRGKRQTYDNRHKADEKKRRRTFRLGQAHAQNIQADHEAIKQNHDLAARLTHAVMISTHVIETVPSLCNRAIFLSDGRIAHAWTTAELKAASTTAGAFEAAIINTFKEMNASKATA